MNIKLKSSMPVVLALLVILTICYGAWSLGRVFLATLSAASPEVTAAIVGAMATILAGTTAVLLSQAHERKRAAEDALRTRKAEIYQGFIDMVSKLLGSANENLSIPEPSEQELARYLFKYKSDILLWGSPKVIRAQIHFEATAGTSDHAMKFRSVNSLYLAIREDVGLSNSGLDNLELVKLYLNDEGRKNLH